MRHLVFLEGGGVAETCIVCDVILGTAHTEECRQMWRDAIMAYPLNAE